MADSAMDSNFSTLLRATLPRCSASRLGALPTVPAICRLPKLEV